MTPVRKYGLIALGLLVAVGAVYAHMKRMADVRAEVNRWQDSLQAVRIEKEALKEKADTLLTRVNALAAKVRRARARRDSVKRRAEERVKRLLARRDTAIEAARSADSAFHALGDSLREVAPPEALPLIEARTRRHVQTVQNGREAISSLNTALASKDSVIASQSLLIRRLERKSATQDSLLAVKDSVIAQQAKEIRFLTEQRDRLEKALDASWFDTLVNSPLTHAGAAAIGFTAGVLAR